MSGREAAPPSFSPLAAHCFWLKRRHRLLFILHISDGSRSHRDLFEVWVQRGDGANWSKVASSPSWGSFFLRPHSPNQQAGLFLMGTVREPHSSGDKATNTLWLSEGSETCTQDKLGREESFTEHRGKS